MAEMNIDGNVLNRGLLVLALVALLALTFFIYANYPKSWRQSRPFKLTLVILHSSGSAAIAVIFLCYSAIPFDWLKAAVSLSGSIYLVVVIMLTILYLLRLCVIGVHRLVLRVRSGHGGDSSADRDVSDRPRSKVVLLLCSATVQSSVFIALAFAVGIVGFLNSMAIDHAHYDVEVHKPASEESLDITMVSDIHAGAGTWTGTYDRIGQLVNEDDPDILLLGGDIFDETTSAEDIARVEDLLSGIHPRYGIYYVYGNHDDAGDDASAKILAKVGVHPLEDEVVVLDDGVQLVGRLDPDLGAGSVDELFDGGGIDPTRPIIVLQHRPMQLQQLSDAGCDLVLAGHTHGFSIPFGFVVAVSNDLVSGERKYGAMTAITSAGASAWGIHYKWPDTNDVVSVHMEFEEQ